MIYIYICINISRCIKVYISRTIIYIYVIYIYCDILVYNHRSWYIMICQESNWMGWMVALLCSKSRFWSKCLELLPVGALFFVGPVNGGHVESGWRNSCVWGTKIRGFTETVNILLNIWKRAKCCTWLGQGFVNHGLRLPEKTLLWHGSMDKNCCHPRFCWWISRCFLNELSEYQPAVSDIEDIDA